MSPPDLERSTGLLVVAGPIADDSDVHALTERLSAVIASCDAQVIVCDVSALPPCARSIEALARLQLTARRHNRHIRLQRASPCLEHLLEFVGLADVMSGKAPSGGQRHRRAEDREHPLCVEERVDRGDPPV